MSPRLSRILLVFGILSSSRFILAQGPPASDPQAAALASQAIAALTGGTSINDVTLTGAVIYSAGDDETGSATLTALGASESRMDLALQSGARTEIRDAQTGTTLGKWVVQSGASGKFAFHNCQTDAVWFFPALTSLGGGSNVVFSYIGQESRNGVNVQHIQSYIYQPSQGPQSVQQLSEMDFYLDATTVLPIAITFNAHPDTDASSDVPIEIDFSNYQVVNGVLVPMHIQKFLQGTLAIDLMVGTAAFNTGITLSNFTVN
jgi:hypothetical protein